MPAQLQALLKLQVPVIVRLAEREMTFEEVLSLAPGSLVEFTKNAEEDLGILVNDRQIGAGEAVKIGENFGVRVTRVGDVRECLDAAAATKPRKE